MASARRQIFDLLAAPISPASERDAFGVLHVIRNLRRLDQAEVFGLRPLGTPPEAVANEVLQICASPLIVFGRLLYRVAPPEKGGAIDQDPCGLVVMYRLAPGLISAGVCGTPDMTPATRALSELILDHFQEARARNVRVAEINVLEDYHTARRWMISLGGEETPLGPIGSKGENFVKVIWRL